MGEYDKALEWYQSAFDGQEKVLGKKHPSTLITVNNLATLFQMKGEYDNALGWFQHALDGWEKAHGKDHLDTLMVVNNIALVFQDRGEYDKALRWYQRALNGREKALGKCRKNRQVVQIRMCRKLARNNQYRAGE